MRLFIEKANDIHELASFITDANQDKQTHIGYCGRELDWNLAALQEDFMQEDGSLHFYIAKDQAGNLLAAIGLDIDESEAEVWGPFNKTENTEIQLQLWNQLLKEYPKINTFDFFINEENIQQRQFMSKIKAKEHDKHLQLKVRKADISVNQPLRSVPFEAVDEAAFTKLHNEAFPDTYYDAATIISRLGEGNILKVLKNETGEMQGYAYFELDRELEDASLEYISISSDFRGQGLGTLLLREVLYDIFSYPEFTEIQLTVDAPNESANRLYFNAGFQLQDTLVHYCFKR
ncbi:GNAT family N-acetyltransferase [Oceanobacillus sp. CAU 1775]